MINNYKHWYQPSYLPIRTLCKFYENHDPKHPNKLFTRTLQKIGFINHDWLDNNPDGEMPVQGEFWLVDVVQEKRPGENKGCFLLDPVSRVEPNNVSRLLPGMYKELNNNGCLVIVPSSPGHHWMMPLKHRQAISPKDDKDAPYAIIVSL